MWWRVARSAGPTPTQGSECAIGQTFRNLQRWEQKTQGPESCWFQGADDLNLWDLYDKSYTSWIFMMYHDVHKMKNLFMACNVCDARYVVCRCRCTCGRSVHWANGLYFQVCSSILWRSRCATRVFGTIPMIQWHRWSSFTAGTDAVVIPLPRNSVTNENGRFQSGWHLRNPLENTATFGSLAMEKCRKFCSFFPF